MVTDTLIDLINVFMNWIVQLLPSWSMTLPEIVHDTISMARAYNDVFPIDESLLCLSAEAVMFGGMSVFKWGIKIVDWVADIIP